MQLKKYNIIIFSLWVFGVSIDQESVQRLVVLSISLNDRLVLSASIMRIELVEPYTDPGEPAGQITGCCSSQTGAL